MSDAGEFSGGAELVNGRRLDLQGSVVKALVDSDRFTRLAESISTDRFIKPNETHTRLNLDHFSNWEWQGANDGELSGAAVWFTNGKNLQLSAADAKGLKHALNSLGLRARTSDVEGTVKKVLLDVFQSANARSF
jgi:hypothetical protein